MMKIHVISRFKDLGTGRYHDPGEVLTVSEARAEHLVAIGCAEDILELDEPTPAKRKRGRPRKTKAMEPEENK